MGNNDQGMQKTCVTLGIIVLIVGIIGSFILAWNNGVTVTYNSYYGMEEERNILLTILWFGCGIFATAIGTVILLSIGEILERLEILSNNVATTESKVNSIEQKNNEKDDITYNNSWKCPKCGRVNNSYTGTCACGQGRNE